MEFEDITERKGCAALQMLFMQGAVNLEDDWDKGYARGVLWALWSAELITEEEHDALAGLLGLELPK